MLPLFSYKQNRLYVKYLNILCINWRDIKNPQAGGAEKYIHNICKIWVKQGHRVTFLSSKFKGSPGHDCIDGINIVRRGDFRLFNFYGIIYAKRLIREQNFDLIIDSISKVPLFTPLFLKKTIVSFFYHRHGLTLFKELSLIVAFIIYTIENIFPIFYRTVPIITISDSTRLELINKGSRESDIHIVHAGIDHKVYKPDLDKKSRSPLFLHVGRLKRYKNIEDLIKVFAIFLETYPDSKFIIAGRGDNLSNLKNLSKKIGIDKSMEFLGYVKENKKIELLQSAWAFLSSSEKEGWGISLIEANACGTPVIAADAPGVRDVVQDGKTGFLVPFGDIDAMTNAVIRITEDVLWRRQLSDNAQKWALNFNWQKTSEEAMDIIRYVMHSKR